MQIHTYIHTHTIYIYRYYLYLPILTIYMLSSIKTKPLQTILKTAVFGIVGLGIIEADIWNRFIIKLYLVHKYDPRM